MTLTRAVKVFYCTAVTLILQLLLGESPSHGFTTSYPTTIARHVPALFRSTSSTTTTTSSYLWAAPPSTMQSANTNTLEQQAADLRAQAAQMRLEAEKMDAALTLAKIEKLERRLNDPKWLNKHKDEEEGLLKQLRGLNQKLLGVSTDEVDVAFTSPTSDDGKMDGTTISSSPAPTPATYASMDTTTSKETRTIDKAGKPPPVEKTDKDRLKENPLEGFDATDLELFLPVAQSIEAEMSNATLEEQLTRFRDEPSLQEHFQKKLQELMYNPLEDLQKLEGYRQMYLTSTSSVEKDSLKRMMAQLESRMESAYSETASFNRGTKPMSQEEMELRIENLLKLPKLLQALYMRRNGLVNETDLELGILMEYYDEQMQLLDQVRYFSPLPDADRDEAIAAYESLPLKLKEHFVRTMSLESDTTPEEVIKAIASGGSFMSTTSISATDMNSGSLDQPPEYNDIEFIERSQYVEELIPSITYLEQVRPTQIEIDKFVNEILDTRTWKLRSKPDRVFGGYFIQGYNAIQGDDANDKLVEKLNAKLEASDLAGKIQFFFIPDPQPLTDEEFEMGVDVQPILVVTGVEPKLLYRKAKLLTKVGITLAGLLSLAVFSFGTCELTDAAMARIEAAIQSDNVEELARLTNNALPVGVSFGLTMMAHEAAHRAIAMRDKFKIGLSSVIPSPQLGLTGTITPLESPPKNFTSLFDFAVAGPLTGFTLSLGLLILGLMQTASMDFSTQNMLPALPVALLRSSALGGYLVEFFLGKGALSVLAPDFSVLQLHPFAVAGFLGLVVNSLALLPLGHTDGGRIALAMFGRRGTYLIKTFVTVGMLLFGLLGLDEYRILLSYAIFALLCQRELEAPMQNEVDQLDDTRSILGFAVFMIVALSLLPMP